MSTVITYDFHHSRMGIEVHAPAARICIKNIDLYRHVVRVTGSSQHPFIQAVRFIDCIIEAPDFSAFHSCVFEQSCTLRVVGSILNNNLVLGAT